MIVTVTPNPALDRAFTVAALEVGQVNRAAATQVDAGGKGINISRALHAQGVPTVAVFPAGSSSGAELHDALVALGVNSYPVPVAGATRSNVTLVDAHGVTTKVNAPGPVLLPDEVANFLAAVKAVATAEVAKAKGEPSGGVVIVGAGSLPVGVSSDFYAHLAQVGAELGVPVAIDTSGEPLAFAIAAGGLALVKPNLEELVEWAGYPLATVGEVVTAARQIIAQGTESVLVSLGADGALLITGATWAWAGGPPLVPRSTVGAGDAMLAGYLASYIEYSGTMPASSYTGSPEIQALKTAVTWGRAAVLQPGTAAPLPSDLEFDNIKLAQEPEFSIRLGGLGGSLCGNTFAST